MAEAAETLAGFEDMFGELTEAGQSAGVLLAEGLVDPALRDMARLMMQAYELRSILTDLPALGGRIADAIASAPAGGRAGGDYTDQSRHFTVNGDVYIRPDDPAGDALLDSLGPRP
ncbi:MAG: hypothetical protein DYG90_08920 [Chloroflexi bacterium CFX6]|nr:hypothetical protein [Chloroflexi bacterium CFX6]